METKINPKDWYSMRDIIEQKLLPCGNSYFLMRRIVAIDKKSKNILQTVITGKGRNIRYYFKGNNIIKFIKAFESGRVKLQ